MSIPRVTDKHLHPDVGTFGVRRVGKTVVVEFGTPQGEFTFHVRERAFVKHARGRADDHGNPFPTLEQIDAEQNRLAQDAATTHGRTAPAEVRAPCVDNRALSPDRRAAYIAAYVELRTTPGATWRQIANKHDLPTSAWSTWTHHHRVECETAVAAARPPVLKPSGSLL